VVAGKIRSGALRTANATAANGVSHVARPGSNDVTWKPTWIQVIGAIDLGQPVTWSNRITHHFRLEVGAGRLIHGNRLEDQDKPAGRLR
jgi:hypothetical protein